MPSESSEPSPLYRTDDLTRWGTGKGSNLTPGEVDLNFWGIDRRLFDVETNPVLPLEIQSISVTANRMTITLSDGVTTFGPFTLPQAAFNYTGDFQANYDYKTFDILKAQGGLYLVLQDHTSGSSFVFEANTEGPIYQLLLPVSLYDIGFFFPGIVGNGVEDGESMFAFRAARDFYLSQDLPESIAELRLPPAADMVLAIYKNTTQIGTITFAAAASSDQSEELAIFNFPADIQFARGDWLRILRPTALDGEARDLTVTLAATKGVL